MSTLPVLVQWHLDRYGLVGTQHARVAAAAADGGWEFRLLPGVMVLTKGVDVVTADFDADGRTLAVEHRHNDPDRPRREIIRGTDITGRTIELLLGRTPSAQHRTGRSFVPQGYGDNGGPLLVRAALMVVVGLGLVVCGIVAIVGNGDVVTGLLLAIAGAGAVAITPYACRNDREPIYRHHQRNAEQQHRQYLAGDDRGIYGDYPPADLD